MRKITNLEKLRAMLPGRYGKAIAQRLNGISATQVKNVFYGKITDPVIVCKVIKEAKVIYVELEKIYGKSGIRKRKSIKRKLNY